MLHHIRSLTGRTLNWLYDHHRRSVPGLDVQDPAAPRVCLYQGGLRKSTNLGHYPLSAVAAGYKVFNVVDASGNWSSMATEITLARIVQAGARPIDTLAVLSEIMGTWNRADAMEYAAIMTSLMPNYQLLMESYDKAQKVQREGRETKLEAAQAKK